MLLLLLCMAGHFLMIEESRKLPTGIELFGEEEIILNRDQLRLLEEDERYGFAMKKRVQIDSIMLDGDLSGKEFPDKRIIAEGWYTDSDYGISCKFNIKYGTYFRVNPVLEFSNDVVISDLLAKQLFFREDVEGEKLQIDGKEYRICGVYKKNKSVLSRITDSASEKVYLPYTDYKTGKDGYSVRFLYDRLESQVHFKEKVKKQLEEKLDITLNEMYLVDFEEYKQLIIQTFQFVIFFIGILVEVWLLRIIWKMAFDGEKSEVGYGHSARWRMGYLGVLLISMATIWYVIAFTITIPSGYLQTDNIFQVSVYLDALAQRRQVVNTWGIYSSYQGYAEKLLETGTGYLVIEMMGWIQIVLLCRKYE